MNRGRIEQLGAPDELYERPLTAFVAGFLGVSNLLPGAVVGADRVRLENGDEISVPQAVLGGRSGRVAVGIRPEKIWLDGGEGLAGTIVERAYVGVSTQYGVETPCGRLVAYVQNAHAEARRLAVGDRVTLGWSPESTFVVDSMEEPE
jgi:spermidine/putrescine transport system ATP-binding protein